jgi:hypothetical protein
MVMLLFHGRQARLPALLDAAANRILARQNLGPIGRPGLAATMTVWR